MDGLKRELDILNGAIRDLEGRLIEAEAEAERNVEPLKGELERLRIDKRAFASRNDFESVQDCNRKESNLKFKINAQWNKFFILKDELVKLKGKRKVLEDKIRLERDKVRRNNEIRSQMDAVLENYRKTHDLKKAAADSKISPDHVEQWLEWGKSGFNETYSYFHDKICEIDEDFRDLEKQKLIRQMDEVVEAYRKTGSLKKASEMANVSYDTVMYWHEWGSRGFGEENAYFFRKIDEI